jgi:hypothetical protein
MSSQTQKVQVFEKGQNTEFRPHNYYNNIIREVLAFFTNFTDAGQIDKAQGQRSSHHI